MEINVEGLADEGEYDERNLLRCPCGEHYLPTKKMFAEFLEKYEDLDGVAEIRGSKSVWGDVEIKVKISVACPQKRR